MKAAHQGVAPSGLLGLAGPGWLSAAPQIPQSSEAAASGAAADRRQSGNGGGGLDSWLLDKLFGRR